MKWGSSWGMSWASSWDDATPVSIPVPAYTLEYRTDPQVAYWRAGSEPAWGADTDPAWPAMGAWLPWTGQLANLQHQGYQFRVKFPAGNIQGKITGLNVIIDMPDVQEEVDNVAISALGTRVTLTKSYQSIKVVSPKLLDDGGTATHIKIVDKDIGGPLLKAYDAAGVLTTAHADVTVQGY